MFINDKQKGQCYWLKVIAPWSLYSYIDKERQLVLFKKTSWEGLVAIFKGKTPLGF